MVAVCADKPWVGLSAEWASAPHCRRPGRAVTQSAGVVSDQHLALGACTVKRDEEPALIAPTKPVATVLIKPQTRPERWSINR
ncbi:hypothetical protein GCM10009738_11390 [Kitasatospora viridis]